MIVMTISGKVGYFSKEEEDEGHRSAQTHTDTHSKTHTKQNKTVTMDLKRKASELSETEIKAYIGQLQGELKQRQKKKKKIDTYVDHIVRNEYKRLLKTIRSGKSTKKQNKKFVELVKAHGRALAKDRKGILITFDEDNDIKGAAFNVFCQCIAESVANALASATGNLQEAFAKAVSAAKKNLPFAVPKAFACEYVSKAEMDKYSLYDCDLAESDGFVIFGFDEDYTLDGSCYMQFQGWTGGGHN